MIALEHAVMAASLAALRDGALLGADNQLRLRVVACRTEHVLPDETVEQVLQLGGVVRSIDDESLVLEVELRLCAQLAAKELGRISGGSANGLGHVHHVDNDGFNAVTLTLDLCLDARHLVAIEGVADASIDV